MKTGVLLMAHGSPDRLEEMGDYLRNVMTRRPPSPEFIAEMTERYRLIGGRSPLLDITSSQARLLEVALGMPVRVGMRSWRPFIADVLKEMQSTGIRTVVALCAAPHYSPFSVGRYHEAMNKTLPDGMAAVQIFSWSAEPALHEVWAKSIEASREQEALVLFTAHSVPGPAHKDQYSLELSATVRRILDRVGDVPWDFAYQSRSPGPGDWHGPDINAKLDELLARGVRKVLAAPIGFVCDHVEILYDLDILHRKYAEGLGIRFSRCGMPNTSPLLIEAMASAVRKALS